MKPKKILFPLALIATVSLLSIFVYKTFIQKPPKPLFKTEQPEKRDIYRIIDTSGTIQVAKKIKIGSLVAGTLKQLFAQENESVTTGQLLAEIDTGKNNLDVKLYQGTLEKAQALYAYQQNYYARQKALYESGQLAKDTFESVTKDYLQSKAEVATAQAQYDKAQMEYNNTKIYAPQNGIIINVGITEGQRVTTDLDATILFEIAEDITKMEAELEIDESDIGLIKKEQKVQFTVDSYPNKIFKSIIKELNYSPKAKNGIQFYKATIDVDNHEELLRPGMTVNAKITVAKAKNALSLTSQAFMISANVLEVIAQELNYAFHPVSKEEKKQIEKEKKERARSVWIVRDNNFHETAVTTGVTDDIYFHITSGLGETDSVVSEIEETSEMQKVLKKAFKAQF